MSQDKKDLELSELIPYIKNTLAKLGRDSHESFNLPDGEYSMRIKVNEKIVAARWPHKVIGYIRRGYQKIPMLNLELYADEKKHKGYAEWKGYLDAKLLDQATYKLEDGSSWERVDISLQDNISFTIERNKLM